jgi:hypothetical protein
MASSKQEEEKELLNNFYKKVMDYSLQQMWFHAELILNIFIS